MLPFFHLNLSETTSQIFKFLLPLSLLTALTILLALATYALGLYPVQGHLTELSSAYQTEQALQIKKETAQATQKTLAKFWNQLPAQQDFTDVGVAIASFAKSHHVRIPGMSYDVQKLKRQQTSKGTLSFEALGRYESIRTFIYELETSWPSLFIEKLAVKRTKKPGEVAFTIKVATFLRTASDT